MEKQTPQELIEKYLTGKATAEEKTMLESWYLVHAENTKDVLPEPDYAGLEHKIWQVIDERTVPVKKEVSLWLRIGSVAAVVAGIAFGVWFYTSSTHQGGNIATKDSLHNDIIPGKSTATLTLAGGRTIDLSDAQTGVVIDSSKITYNDGSLVQNNAASPAAGEKMTVSTPRGGTYQITLSDGTKVWLNAASSLTYSTALNSRGERSVKLTGEGYFEVTKDKDHPFIVETQGQQVKVLGTHFNINSYLDDGSIKTTLLEGSVQVAGDRTQSIILKPGQQSILTVNNKLQVKDVNADNVIAWKNGLFMFNDEPLAEVMQKISRWYGVEVSISDPALSARTVYGTISRYSNVSGVLDMLEKTGEMQFEIEGDLIKVKRK